MSTAQEIIDNSLQLLAVVDPAETPSTTERNIGLVELNKVIDELSATGISIPWLSTDSVTLTGTNNYQIGIGLTVNTQRPLLIKSAATLVSNFQHPAKVCAIEEYEAIADKARTGKLVEKVAFVPLTAAAGVIFVWPLVNGGALSLWSYKAMTQLGSLSTNLSVPVGYESAIQQLLAMRLAPRYPAFRNLEVLARNAAESLTTIRNLNAAVLGAVPSLVPPAPPTQG